MTSRSTMCALAGPRKRLCIRGKLQTVGTSTAHSIGKFVIIEQFEPDKVALVARLELGTMQWPLHVTRLTVSPTWQPGHVKSAKACVCTCGCFIPSCDTCVQYQLQNVQMCFNGCRHMYCGEHTGKLNFRGLCMDANGVLRLSCSILMSPSLHTFSIKTTSSMSGTKITTVTHLPCLHGVSRKARCD